MFSELLLHALSLLAAVYLWAVTVRRILLTIAAISSREPELPDWQRDATVLVLVPVRNEAGVVEGCIQSLLSLEWPSHQIRIAIIDDGSTDVTPQILKKYAKHPLISILTRPQSDAGKGKPDALNFGLLSLPFGDLVYVVDADARVSPDALKILAANLNANKLAAVQGSMLPENPHDSNAAFYAFMESLVHQGLTMTGARNLDATVSLLGSNYLLRRKLIQNLGGFDSKTRLEDVDLSLILQNNGYQVGFEPRARSSILASRNMRDASAQHRAWSRGFWSIAAKRMLDSWAIKAPLISKLDRIIFSFGYADRIALVAYLACSCLEMAGSRSFSVPPFLIFYLSIPAFQCILALRKYHRPARDYRRLLFIPIGFVVDIVTNLGALMDALRGRSTPWVRTERK